MAWAGRFDREGSDLLALQDEIAAQVAAQIDPEILMLEARRAGTWPSEEATAYELMLRALPLMHRMERAPFIQAGERLRHAIELEHDFAAAHGWLGYWHVFLSEQGWAEQGWANQEEAEQGRADPDAMAEHAGRIADRAIRLDPFDPRLLSQAGHVRAVLQREPQAAAVLHQQALSLNPNLAMAWALSGLTQAWLGNVAEAERRLARYKLLTPLHPFAFVFDGAFTVAGLLAGGFERAAAAGRAATQMNPAFLANYKPYLSALGHLGRAQETAVTLRRLLALEPGFSVARFLRGTPLERAQDRELFAEGLRRAGVAEGGPLA